MNILVTGANGQLGNEMRLLAPTTNDKYIFTDVGELDITDIDAVCKMVENEKVDVVVNCAAYTNVEKAEDDERTAFLLNSEAVENLAVACKLNDAFLVHVSTDYVFDGKACQPYTEDAPTAPTGAYGRTKLAGEQAVIDSGCKYVIVRTAWLYSEFGKNFVKTMLKLTAEKDELKVVFDQVGSPTYAGDLAAAIIKIIASNAADKQGIYHFTDEGVCSWYDFTVAIARNAGHTKCSIAPCHSDEFPTKVARPHFSVLDKTKIKTTFGITIPHWTDSLARCMSKMKNE
ncbi:MAG: dTDP-4-dehydrorhamnose reductase [Bacteroidales bacterium]|nr:dTDP-4-dehydrorhamnose reductase [Bacteroidales bacterium]